MNISGMLNSKADVYTLSTSKSGIGGVSESYGSNPRLANVPCRARALKGSEVPALGKERENSTHRIYFGQGVEINDTDKIVIAGRDYDVTFDNDVDLHGDLLQVDARRRGRV